MPPAAAAGAGPRSGRCGRWSRHAEPLEPVLEVHLTGLSALSRMMISLTRFERVLGFKNTQFKRLRSVVAPDSLTIVREWGRRIPVEVRVQTNGVRLTSAELLSAYACVTHLEIA